MLVSWALGQQSTNCMLMDKITDSFQKQRRRWRWWWWWAIWTRMRGMCMEEKQGLVCNLPCIYLACQSNIKQQPHVSWVQSVPSAISVIVQINASFPTPRLLLLTSMNYLPDWKVNLFDARQRLSNATDFQCFIDSWNTRLLKTQLIWMFLRVMWVSELVS